MKSFDDLNDKIVFIRVETHKEALGLNSLARKVVAEEGKTAIIFFEGRYHQQLAPGHDPYQVRKEIDNWLVAQEKKEKLAAAKKIEATQAASKSLLKKSSK